MNKEWGRRSGRGVSEGLAKLLDAEGEPVLQTVAEQVEEGAVEGDDGQGGKGHREFGEAEGVEGAEGGQQEHGGKDVGDEHCLESAAGLDDDVDALAGGVVPPLRGVDVDNLLFLLGEGAVGVCRAGGAGADHLHLHFHYSTFGGDDGAGV